MKKQPNWEVLIRELKEIAQDKKITQVEISEKSGIRQPHVSRFFEGKIEPKLSTFLDIAHALNINVKLVL